MYIYTYMHTWIQLYIHVYIIYIYIYIRIYIYIYIYIYKHICVYSLHMYIHRYVHCICVIYIVHICVHCITLYIFSLAPRNIPPSFSKVLLCKRSSSAPCCCCAIIFQALSAQGLPRAPGWRRVMVTLWSPWEIPCKWKFLAGKIIQKLVDTWDDTLSIDDFPTWLAGKSHGNGCYSWETHP